MKLKWLIALLFANVMLVSCAYVSPTLSIKIEGNGSVAVFVGGRLADTCQAASCTFSYPRGSRLQLRAEPGEKQYFLSWRGSCGGYSNCELNLEQEAEVIAEFKPARGSFTARLMDEAVAVPRGGEGRLNIEIIPSDDFNVPDRAIKVELEGPIIGEGKDQVKARYLGPSQGYKLVVALSPAPETPIGIATLVKVRVGLPGMYQEVKFGLMVTECAGGCDAD